MQDLVKVLSVKGAALDVKVVARGILGVKGAAMDIKGLARKK